MFTFLGNSSRHIFKLHVLLRLTNRIVRGDCRIDKLGKVHPVRSLTNLHSRTDGKVANNVRSKDSIHVSFPVIVNSRCILPEDFTGGLTIWKTVICAYNYCINYVFNFMVNCIIQKVNKNN